MFRAPARAVMRQVPALVAQRTLGLAAVGAMAIANNISVYANRVDDMVTDTIYPVDLRGEGPDGPAAGDVPEVQPAGAAVGGAERASGIALFAPDLVHYVLGSRWETPSR